MPIDQIGRQVGEVNVSAAYTAKPEDTLIVCNATDAGFTVTLYKDLDSGAYHRLIVKISDSDESGNTVTITDGTFSTTLASTSAAVELETDYDGDWLAVASFPTLDANTAISAADSAGLAASSAESAAVSTTDATSLAQSTADSAGLAASAADSGVTANTATISINKSIAASATLSGTSASQSIAASATLSGTSASQSIAASATLSGTSASQSIAASATTSGVSNAISTATSQHDAQSAVMSENLSTALSAADSAAGA